MAAVTVFVDDAVLGRMPYVCVKTGAPAEGLLTVHTSVGSQPGVGGWWLLVLFGPLGWAALLIIIAVTAGRRREQLTVQLPWTEAAQDELDKARRRRRALWLAALAALTATGVVFQLGPGLGGQMAALLLLVTTGFAVAALVAGIAVDRAQIDVTIDGSRRWVALHGVHDDFAHAVETSRTGRQPAAP
jgi:hypothetical protein